MPITGTFEADFSQFSSATQAATADLKGLQTTATTTTTAITGLEKASTTTATAGGTLTSSWRSFDGALSAVGIHIGPQVQGLIDLGNAAGKSGTELGALTTAGLLASAALAGWNLGRWVADITGADKAIGSLTAKLMGWGDLAKETAGAVQDSIDLAFQRTGIHATSAAQALALNTKWAKEHQAAAKEDAAETKAAADAYAKWEAATEEIATATKGYTAILQNLDPYVVAAATRALEHGVKQQTVATAYKLTEAQVRAVSQALEAHTAASKAAAEQAAKDAKIIADHWNDVGKILDDVLGVPQLKKATDWVDAITALGGSVEKLSNQQLVELQTAMQGGIAALAASGNLTSVQSSQFAELASKAQAVTESLKVVTEATADYSAEAEAATKANDALIASMARTTAAATDAQRAQAVKEAGPGATEGQIAAALARITGGAAPSNIVGAGLYPGSVPPATGGYSASQTAAMRAGASFGGGTFGAGGGYTDPLVQAYMSQGYTLNEALMIATGQGAHIIGRSSAQLASLGYRASGGPVSAGSGYIVGERGPELFTPNVSGTITPGGGGVQIVINGSVLSTQAELAALVERAMVAAYRRGGNRLPV